jgi:hypothetical protein
LPIPEDRVRAFMALISQAAPPVGTCELPTNSKVETLTLRPREQQDGGYPETVDCNVRQHRLL